MRQQNKRKGQVTIDFLVTLTVVVTLFFAITIPLMHDSLHNASVMQSKQLVNANAQKIRMVMKTLLQEGSGAQQALDLRAPLDCYYYIDTTILEGGYSATALSALCTGDSAGVQEIIGYPAYGIDYQCPACGQVNVPGVGSREGIKGGEKIGFIIRRIY